MKSRGMAISVAAFERIHYANNWSSRSLCCGCMKVAYQTASPRFCSIIPQPKWLFLSSQTVLLRCFMMPMFPGYPSTMVLIPYDDA